MTNLSTSNDGLEEQQQYLETTTTTNDISNNNNNIVLSPPFNSKFFKDINDKENGGNILKKSFSHLKNDSSNNKSFEDENLFDQGGQSYESSNSFLNNNEFNGASSINNNNGGNNNNILSTSPPVKIKLKDTHYELIQNGSSINSGVENNSNNSSNKNNKNKLIFEEIVNNNNNNEINSVKRNNIKSSGGIMGLLSTSSSSFVEKPTPKERIRYFFNFIVHHIKTSTWKTWLKLGIFGLIVMGICLAIFKFKVQNHLEVLQEFVKKFGIPLGGLVYVGVFMLLIIFLIPVTIPTIIGGMIFKLWFGILFVWSASMLGGLVAFFLGRYVFRKRIAKRIEKNRKLTAVDQAIGQEGWKIVLLLRLTPIVPESLLNYALSVTKVKFLHYVICSGIGMVPGCSFFVYIGSMITNISDIGSQGTHMKKGEIAMYVISAVLMVVSILFITIIVKRAVNKKLEAEDQKGLLDEEEGLMNDQDDLVSGNDHL